MMAAPAALPLLLPDVDGPLIPFRARTTAATCDAGEAVRAADQASGNPLIDRLDAADGPRLLALGCQLVWATTWMADANDIIAPRLGLPELLVVEFADDDEPEHGLHWKTRFLTRWAAGRTFVWLDDELTDTDRRWVRIHHPGKALLHRVDPLVGLSDADYASIGDWLAM
ncbi:hypothetical protein [Pilimelia columellifera]|uniref:HAD domain-containing protein n=1 Tax=Pilimelia columellifera subsp. columellifera TaxID=706583 RepID=A0ABN3NRG9_9ACTN